MALGIGTTMTMMIVGLGSLTMELQGMFKTWANTIFSKP